MSDASNNFYIDRTLYYGKPEDLSVRLEKEIRSYDLLDRLEIPYQRLDHAPLPTIDACREVDSLLNIDICKNLFLCNAKRTEFLLTPASWEKEIPHCLSLKTNRILQTFHLLIRSL